MSTGWDNYDPAPIETFHGEALKRFHEVAKVDHGEIEKAFDRKLKTIDGIVFSNLIAECKVKIMKEYGITSDAVPRKTNNNG